MAGLKEHSFSSSSTKLFRFRTIRESRSLLYASARLRRLAESYTVQLINTAILAYCQNCLHVEIATFSNSFALAHVIRATFLACDLMMPKSKGWVVNYYLTMYGESS